MWMRKNNHVRTPLVFMMHSYTDKILFFATCDSDEHCSMDATVVLLYVEYVTAVCLYM